MRGGQASSGLATIPSASELPIDDVFLPSSLSSGQQEGNQKRPVDRIRDRTKGSMRGVFTVKGSSVHDPMEEEEEEDPSSESEEESNEFRRQHSAWWHRCISPWMHLQQYDLTPWLMQGVEHDDSDTPYFSDRAKWTMAGFVRHYFYNPIKPEFTSMQLFCWAIVIGIAMGIFTAAWKSLVEAGIHLTWSALPQSLVLLGFFTDLDGWFPLYHYMWIVPTIFGAVLSYVFVKIPIPGQNEWISALHNTGVQDYRTFWSLFILSTLGMMSGLSLGPELPLILTSGMLGSRLGLVCRQSMLQARVLNLTAASAAIGGFFGFPMAGALFVLELPHRTGLQYFEALTPSVLSSIVAVITNRLIISSDVAGYFKYPFLDTSLPSSIFWHAIVYGIFGCAVGTGYLVIVSWYKKRVHEWFQPLVSYDHHDFIEQETSDKSQEYCTQTKDRPDDNEREETESNGLSGSNEAESLLGRKTSTESDSRVTSVQALLARLYSCSCLVIPKEPHRAAVAGAVAGFMCGWVAIFVPHTLFWGEAQLQNLIDKGRTDLPVFSDKAGDMTALGYCIIDPMDPAAIRAGFPIQCSALLAVSKTIVIGLSLGTGIVGGHFWGPLFVGCAAGHFFSDLVNMIAGHFIDLKQGEVFAYPCLTILCTMGAAHVVSFRAHTAIMLILTLTISTFSPQDENPYFGMAGDYAAIFPLLVISVFISMMMSQDMVFYKEQQNRGDILAVQEVLCEPQMGSSIGAIDGQSRGQLTLSPIGSPTHSKRGRLHQSGSSITDYESVGSVKGSATPSLVGKNETGLADIEKGLGESRGSSGAMGQSGVGDSASANATLLSARLDELLATPSGQEAPPNAIPEGPSHRIVNSAGELKFAPTLFEQARAHRESQSRRNSISSASDVVEGILDTAL